ELTPEGLDRLPVGHLVPRGPLGERGVAGLVHANQSRHRTTSWRRLLSMIRRGRARPGALRADLLAYQALHLAAVGTPLRLAHHSADDGADRILVPGAALPARPPVPLARRAP